MRTLSTYNSGQVAQAITAPAYLISMGFTPTLYVTTRDTNVVWNANTFQGGVGAELTDMKPGNGGILSGSVKLRNTDNAASALVLAQGCRDLPVQIWAIYGNGPWAVGDAELILSGVMDAPTRIDFTQVVIPVTSVSESTLYVPRMFCAQVCNHMPAQGAVIVWGSEKYILRSGGN